MRKVIVIGVLAAALAAPAVSHANCHDRKVTGTVIGGVAGGLLGNAVSRGGGRLGGTLIGAGVGALAGHEIAGAGCHSEGRRYYRHTRYRHAYGSSAYADPPPMREPVRCEMQQQPYYDERGRVIYQSAQVCR